MGDVVEKIASGMAGADIEMGQDADPIETAGVYGYNARSCLIWAKAGC
jgi:hypothetical protein